MKYCLFRSADFEMASSHLQEASGFEIALCGSVVDPNDCFWIRILLSS
jgi:hypothetical protein